MATNEKVIELSNRVKSIKSSSNPETNHIIAGADDIFDDSKRKKQSTINQETDEALNDRYTKEETYSKSQLNNMVAPQHDYITVATYADLSNLSEHPIGCVYRVSNYDGINSQVDATKYSEYSWDGTQYIHLATKSQIGEVFDVSVYNATGGTLATYDSLDALLSDANINTIIPEDVRQGGMRLQFVLTGDNKYVHYMCKSSTWSITPTDWEKINNVSISQNTETGHTGISLDDVTTPVASVEDVTEINSVLLGGNTGVNKGFINISNVLDLTAGSGICIPVKSGWTVQLKAKDTVSGTVFAFLKTNCYKTGVATFSESYSTRISLGRSELSIKYTVPADCNYLWVWYTGSTNADEFVENIFINDIDVVDGLEQAFFNRTNELDTAIKTNTNHLLKIDKEVKGYNNDDVTFNRYINSVGKWASTDVNKYRITLVKVHPYDIVNIQAKGNDSAYYILQDNDLTIGNTPNFATGYSEQVVVPDGTSTGNVTIPSNGNYLVVVVWYNNKYYYAYSIKINGVELLDVQDEFKKQQEQIDTIVHQVVGLQEQCGEKKYNETPITPSWNNGGIDGSTIGSTISLSTSTGYRYMVTTCVAEDKFKCHINQTTSATYAHYICFTDADNKVLAAFAPLKQTAGYYDYIVEAPVGTAKIYVATRYSQDILPNVSINKLSIITLQTQIDELNNDEIIGVEEGQSRLDIETFNLWKINRFNELYDTSETTGYNALKNTVNARSSEDCLKLAVCSDTHFGGLYATTPLDDNRRTSERCFRIFDKVANNLCSGAVHCGDISTDYGVSKNTYLTFMRAVIERFTHSKPFFITKGNHDVKDNEYQEVPLTDIDFDNNTYYVGDGHGDYTATTEETWNGSKLYIHNKDLISDKQFINVAQRYKCPTTAFLGDGAYFYYDYTSHNIRVIVLNSFAVNDDGEYFSGDMFKWFAETALDFSDKETPSDWAVLLVQHLSLDDSGSSKKNALLGIINAFKNSSSVSSNFDGVSYSKDYSSQGAGNFIALLHGHKHSYTYNDQNGVNELGMTWTNYYAKPTSQHPNEWGDATKYGISVVSIDVANRKIYDDQISGTTREYEY